MNRRFLLAALAASPAFASMAFAQSSDVRQNEQNVEAAERQRRAQRQQYLPGDRRRVEQAQREADARQRGDSRRDDRSGRGGYDRRDDDRRDYSRRDYDRRDGRGYSGYRAEDWGHSGRGAGPDRNWYRGSRLPPQYRSRQYVIDDWRAHRLSAPPRGYHWVQAGSDYVLVAIATGIIASILLSR